MRDLQGVWRLYSMSMDNNPVHSQQTHLVVAGDEWREVWDRVLYSDEPRPETRFSVEGTFLKLRTTWHQPDGTTQGPFAGTWAFELDEDELRVCAAGYDLVPTTVDDSQGTVTVYRRETDTEEIARISAPATIADKPTRHHPVLGELRWDGNLSWYKSADGLIALDIGFDDPLDAHCERASQLVGEEQRLKLAAADRLLELHNSEWRRGGPEQTREGFAAKLVLDSVTIYEDLSAAAYFEDGDLFWGHVVIVHLDSEGAVTEALFAG